MTPEQKKFVQTLINRLNNLEARVEILERKNTPIVKGKIAPPAIPTEAIKEKYILDIDYYRKKK